LRSENQSKEQQKAEAFIRQAFQSLLCGWCQLRYICAIKEKLGVSDRETVEQIRENPYLQYFIGKLSYSNEVAFDPSLLVHFRQRISAELVNKVNLEVVRRLRETDCSDSEKKNKK
jgi:hypothetical protein